MLWLSWKARKKLQAQNNPQKIHAMHKILVQHDASKLVRVRMLFCSSIKIRFSTRTWQSWWTLEHFLSPGLTPKSQIRRRHCEDTSRMQLKSRGSLRLRQRMPRRESKVLQVLVSYLGQWPQGLDCGKLTTVSLTAALYRSSRWRNFVRHVIQQWESCSKFWTRSNLESCWCSQAIND